MQTKRIVEGWGCPFCLPMLQAAMSLHVFSYSSQNLFFKWFMVLEENQDHGNGKEVVEVKEEEKKHNKRAHHSKEEVE